MALLRELEEETVGTQLKDMLERDLKMAPTKLAYMSFSIEKKRHLFLKWSLTLEQKDKMGFLQENDEAYQGKWYQEGALPFSALTKKTKKILKKASSEGPLF